MIKKKNEIILVDIQILPEFQNKGIGASLLKSLVEEASKEKKNILLSVLKVNKRAQNFYKKFGFEIINDNKTHFFMRYYFK